MFVIRLAYIYLAFLLAAPALAQFNGPSGGTLTFCVQGPGDVQPYVAWGSVWRAYSMATCGMPAVNVCNSTGGVDVACADMVTSTTTGKLVPNVIGGLTCGTDNSGNCTIKIIYDIPGAGAHNAVQNTISLRYGLYNGAVSGCNSIGAGNCGFSNASGAGYTLTASLSLTQPFALMVLAYSNNASGVNTLLSVGNAAIEVSNTGNTNVLSTCDSSNSTATNGYQYGFAPSYLSEFILTCLGGSGSLYQNTFASTNQQSGGSTSVSGVPSLIVNSSAAATNFWEFGITTSNITTVAGGGGTGFWTLNAIHVNACEAIGYTCYYSGMGDVTAFNAAWGLRAYNAAATAGASGQALVNVCSPADAYCGNILSQSRIGNALINTVGGELGNACYTTIASGTYTAGAVVLTLNTPPGDGNATGLVSGSNFALTQVTGTGSFALLNNSVFTAGTGTGPTTLNFTGPTGTGTITGGIVSSCTIKTFYDICTIGGVPCNSCTGGVPCPVTQATIGNRAIMAVDCIYPGIPLFYGQSCAIFTEANSQSYIGPAASNTSLPLSIAFVAQRTGNTSAYNTVFGGTGATASAGFGSSPNTAYFQDGYQLGAPTANDNLFHSVMGESDGTNLHVYVDGVLSNTTATMASGAMVPPYVLGNKGGASLYFQGILFEAGLASSDITALAASLSAQQQLYWGYH